MTFPYKSIAFLLLLGSTGVNANALDNARLALEIKQEEQRLQARIGVAMIDTASDRILNYRGHERFPLNSTVKVLLCGALLSEVDKRKVALSESVQFEKNALVSSSPVTEKFLKPDAMNWQQLCSAAISHSDNTAANLIGQKVDGPAAMNLFLSGLGDSVTHLDRDEPELNSAVPGDVRDTTQPVAIVQTLQKLALGKVLKPTSRQQLVQWMRDDKVADALLRSALPSGWTIADKTGAGGYGSRSIISILWPTNSKPLIIAIYITQTPASLAQSNAAIARIGKHLFSIVEQ